MAQRWYVVQSQSNFENKVKQSLQERISREGLEEFFCQIIIPTEEFVEIRLSKEVIPVKLPIISVSNELSA